MTTLLLVFVCLRVVTAATSVELSGTCRGVWENGTEQCAVPWPHPQAGNPCTHSLSLLLHLGSQGDDSRQRQFSGK